MYTVHGVANKTVWDKDKHKVLARFKDGLFKTDNKDIADKLEKLGYDVKEGEKMVTELERKNILKAREDALKPDENTDHVEADFVEPDEQKKPRAKRTYKAAEEVITDE